MFHRGNSESRSTFRSSIIAKPRMWKDLTSSMDCERGARLLLDFKSIAADELQHTKIDVPRIPKTVPRISALIPLQWEDSSGSEDKEEDYLTPMKRLRTVSVSFDEPPSSPLRTSPTYSYDDSESTTSSPGSLTFHRGVVEVTPDTRRTVIELPDTLKQVETLIGRPSPSKLVGTEVKGPVKAVLQRKFSWKNYPALEAYLVKHREEYLQYSSALNYTAEQKRYNNTLTQGLLDLAEEEGYLFEDFTFAAIRDRIRCYYKSYVQATKKKKKRKRGSF